MDYGAHLFIFLSLIFANLPGSEAVVYCYSRYCSNRCCGDIFNHYCCSSFLSTGDIVGIVFGCCVIGVIIVVIVCAVKKSKGSSGRVLPQTTIIHNTGQPQMQHPPPYKPPNYAQSQGQPSPAYPPPAAMYNHPPQSNPPPPGFQTTPQANYGGTPIPGNPPPPGFQPNYSGASNSGNPPPPGFIATPSGGSQGQQPNPFAQAAQKSS